MGLPRRLANVAAILLVAALVWAFGGREPPRAPTVPRAPAASTAPATPAPPSAPTAPSGEVGLLPDVAVESYGRVVYRGPVDLRPTLARIARGERLAPFRDDGIVFQNRERRLPERPRGHYREWVHPTEGQGGPGAQRVVTGGDGEVFYTPDHYGSFRRVK